MHRSLALLVLAGAVGTPAASADASLAGLAVTNEAPAALGGKTFTWTGRLMDEQLGKERDYWIELAFRDDGYLVRTFWIEDQNTLANPRLSARSWRREGDRVVIQQRFGPAGDRKYKDNIYRLTPQGLERVEIVGHDGSALLKRWEVDEADDKFYALGPAKGPAAMERYQSESFRRAPEREYRVDAYFDHYHGANPPVFVPLDD